MRASHRGSASGAPMLDMTSSVVKRLVCGWPIVCWACKRLPTKPMGESRARQRRAQVLGVMSRDRSRPFRRWLNDLRPSEAIQSEPLAFLIAFTGWEWLARLSALSYDPSAGRLDRDPFAHKGGGHDARPKIDRQPSSSNVRATFARPSHISFAALVTSAKPNFML